MAVIKQGILGGFSGSIANVVGSSWKGIAVIKAKPLSVANPKTAAQTTNRNQFSETVAFAVAVLVSTIKPLLDRIAVKMSGYNFFVQLNKSLFDSTGLITPADLVISQATVEPISTFAGVTDVGNDNIDFTWSDNTGTGDSLATDELYGCIYNATKNEAISIPPGTSRDTELLEVDTPVDWDDADIKHLYSAFRRSDGSRASNTSYALAT